jgi:hypothetical protein
MATNPPRGDGHRHGAVRDRPRYIIQSRSLGEKRP